MPPTEMSRASASAGPPRPNARTPTSSAVGATADRRWIPIDAPPPRSRSTRSFLRPFTQIPHEPRARTNPRLPDAVPPRGPPCAPRSHRLSCEADTYGGRSRPRSPRHDRAVWARLRFPHERYVSRRRDVPEPRPSCWCAGRGAPQPCRPRRVSRLRPWKLADEQVPRRPQEQARQHEKRRQHERHLLLLSLPPWLGCFYPNAATAETQGRVPLAGGARGVSCRGEPGRGARRAPRSPY